MSAFVVTYNKQPNTPGAPGVLGLAMRQLSHRGPDGMNVLESEKISMGHWHFWTTPEEIGEHQPLFCEETRTKIVFDGRIDNRNDLLETLQLDAQTSDAMLFLHAYSLWGMQAFVKVIGEFAAALYDQSSDTLICVRDPLGDRVLFYSHNGPQLVVASEPRAIAHALNIEAAVNERAVVHFFANQTPPENQSYFNDVYELLPAQVLIANGSSIRVERYWQPDLTRLRLKNDDEYSARFLDLLEQAVVSRMRSSGRVGVMMSGGLDSTSVAALAARFMAPGQLTTVSFTFPSIPESNEQDYIEAMRQKWNLDSLQIPCDDVWTFKDWAAWKPNPNHPGGGVHYHMMQRVYETARHQGLRVLLTGAGGDPLYHAGREWLADLLLEGRIREALRQLLFLARNYGLKYFVSRPYLRIALRRLAERAAPFLRNKFHRSAANGLLTDYSNSILALEKNADDRHAMLLGPSFAFSISRDAFTAGHYGIEMRNPYRDRRLVEFALRIPAYQFFHNGMYKHILRNAMRGLLPDLIRERKYATSILPLYLRGFREETWLAVEVKRSAANLKKYINPEVVIQTLANPVSSSNILSPWQCLSYDKWRHSIN